MPIRSYQQKLSGSSLGSRASYVNGDTPDANSRGARFIASLHNKGFNNPLNDLVRLNREFYDFLAGDNWEWDGGVMGNSYIKGAQLLDGAINKGECAYVARALAYLINVPAPYGFNTGLALGDATVEYYSGEHGKGFISTHDTPLPGPVPNIRKPYGGMLAGHYLWPNHKVVKYGDRYLDPNYRKTYLNPSDMAKHQLSLFRQQARLRDLKEYNWFNPVSCAKLIGVKIKDAYYMNYHIIDVFKASGEDNVSGGYYIGWDRNWQGGCDSNWYGPYKENPFAR